jgi:hypothetical protein
LGAEFREAYRQSSDEPPPHLIIDDQRDAAGLDPFADRSSQAH